MLVHDTPEPSRRSIGIGGFAQEVNTFSPLQTDLTAFAPPTGTILRSRETMTDRLASDCPPAGFIPVVEESGFAASIAVDAFAAPSGTIVQSVYEKIRDELVTGLLAIPNPAGFLVSLHGAAVADGYPDPEGDIVTRLRAARPDIPIGLVLDHHAGVSEALVAASDVIVGFKTEPHIDTKSCGERAARVVIDLIEGKLERIDRCLVRLPLMLPTENLLTTRGPLSAIMQHVLELTDQENVVDISLFPGFCYSDSPATGASVLAQTRAAPDLARELAIEIADELWQKGSEFWLPLASPSEAVERALRSQRTPVVLVDKADHPGAGGVGDDSLLLRLLCQSGATSTVVAPLHDPRSVERAIAIGVGGSGPFSLGGLYTGEPFTCEARVRLLSDGHYEALGPVDHGAHLSNGRTAVLEIGGVEAVVCEGRSGLNDPEQLRRVGIEPTRRRILCIKGLGTFRAAFESIVDEIILVDGEGPAPQRLVTLPYRHVQRPIDPLDADVAFDAAAVATLIPGRTFRSSR